MNIYQLLGIDLEDPGQKLAVDMMRSERAMLDALIRERARRGISQEDLGREMGVTQSAVARFEGGERDPRLSTLRRYAAALDMRITFDVKPATARRPDAAAVLESSNHRWMTNWKRSDRSLLPAVQHP